MSLTQWLGVIDQDEKDVRILEEEATCRGILEKTATGGAQESDRRSRDAEVYGEDTDEFGDDMVYDEGIDEDEVHQPILDQDRFHRPILDDSESGME
ncbi:hypothetical protein E4U49_007837 [Claviceps purpurea]|nr:hypothetical protein E4U49_007837 [Claviceps purpurea]